MAETKPNGNDKNTLRLQFSRPIIFVEQTISGRRFLAAH
jgi:hypothetical protein